MKELQEILSRINAASGGAGVLATLVAAEGSSYRRPGARMLAGPDGARHGSISGGCLEEDVLARARAVQSSGRPEVVVYDTTTENDLVWGVGLGCHGVVSVLLERLPARPAWAAACAANIAAGRNTDLAVVWGNEAPGALRYGEIDPRGTWLAAEVPPASAVVRIFRQTIKPPPHLAIFGAGDDARPLAQLAAGLGWRVTVADVRPAFATSARFPTAATVVVGAPETLPARASLGPEDLAVVMTHHYLHDVPLLKVLLPQPLAYLGLLGPRKRAERILADVGSGQAHLHAPVGLDIGAETPEEVALAILAEMQSVLRARDARPLRERKRPIHS